MPRLDGFMFPRTATGRSSILPPPPWHYSGDLLTIEYRTAPERVVELLPEQMTPAHDPGAVAIVWANWQSCGDDFAELDDPIRAQYREVFFVIRGRYEGEHRSRCAYIWVDKDFAMVRGHFQGYPKKLGSIWMTRPVAFGRAGPRLAPGGRFGATLAAGDRRLAEATFTITGEVATGGFVNSHAMVHSRYMPRIEADGRASLDELVTMKAVDVDAGPIWSGQADLTLHDVPGEEYPLLHPHEMIGAYYQQLGVTFPGGTTLEDLTQR